jgi:hypothetical protein
MKMQELEKRAMSGDRSHKSFWDELGTASFKVQAYRSLDAAFLDDDIHDLSGSLYEPETESNPWPNAIRFACYRNGKLPSDPV